MSFEFTFSDPLLSCAATTDKHLQLQQGPRSPPWTSSPRPSPPGEERGKTRPFRHARHYLAGSLVSLLAGRPLFLLSRLRVPWPCAKLPPDARRGDWPFAESARGN